MLITKDPPCKPAQDFGTEQWDNKVIFFKKSKTPGLFLQAPHCPQHPYPARECPFFPTMPAAHHYIFHFPAFFLLPQYLWEKKNISKKPKDSLSLKYRLNNSHL